MLKSYISNRKNEFEKYVKSFGKNNLDSDKTKDLKDKLFKINKAENWFTTEKEFFKNIDLTKENKKEYEDKFNIILCARKIFKRILSKNKFPSTNKINMVLNDKVFDILPTTDCKGSTYTLGFRTSMIKLEEYVFGFGKGLKSKKCKHVFIPLKTNTRFDEKLLENIAKLNNSAQLNFDKSNKLKSITLSLTKDVADKERVDVQTEYLAFDFGLKTCLTSNKGDFFGQKFGEKLEYYDKKIQTLSKELKKRDKNYKLSTNKRYSKLVACSKAFIENEICRILNRAIKLYKPKYMIFENLNFRGSKMSKKLNRLISNCGMSVLKEKLKAITEDYGIIVVFINPAYTSQKCNKCHHTEKANRKNQKEFLCRCCGHKTNADLNASRNILERFLDTWFKQNKYATRVQIKQYLEKQNLLMFVPRAINGSNNFSIPVVNQTVNTLEKVNGLVK